jgi:hypothetical protein
MSSFTFTPDQRKEAMKWITENCIDLINLAETFEPREAVEYCFDNLIDMYFKLKNVPFSFKPNEFIVGVEYKSEAKIRAGKEIPNVHINNPHKLVAQQFTHDQFALTLLYSLFKNQQI